MLQVHAGPYVFCAPFNLLPTVDLAKAGYDAAGFVTLSSNAPLIFNLARGRSSTSSSRAAGPCASAIWTR